MEIENNGEESITDIVNSLVGQEETPGIEQDYAKAKADEAQSRNQAMQEVRKEQTSSMTNEARKAVGSYKAQLEEMRKEMSGLKDMLKERDNKYSAIEKDVQTHSDRMLTDDVIAKENQLAKNPKYQGMFNRDEVRNHYINAAKNEKRFFDPEESFKILNYDKLAEKLEKYEKQNEFRKSLMEGGFQSSTNIPDDDGLSDVKDPEAAYQWMKKKAGQMGL